MNDTPRNGMRSAEHNAMNLHDYYARMRHSFDAMTTDTPVIFDLCAGGGRDTVYMRDYLTSLGKSPQLVAVDDDGQRLKDALYYFKGQFTPCFDPQQVTQTLKTGRLAYLYDSLPDINALVQTGLKADFILCNAGIMFIAPERLSRAFNTMADILKDGGEIMIRYSNYRPSPYPNGYYKHKLERVLDIFNRETNLKADHIGDMRDTNWDHDKKRQFHWHDLQVLKK